VRCIEGRVDQGRSLRECKLQEELDLKTLIWTRGRAFPISMLDGRLKCPRCGSRRVPLLFDLPKEPMAKRRSTLSHTDQVPNWCPELSEE
jgi:hypothetical protein